MNNEIPYMGIAQQAIENEAKALAESVVSDLTTSGVFALDSYITAYLAVKPYLNESLSSPRIHLHPQAFTKFTRMGLFSSISCDVRGEYFYLKTTRNGVELFCMVHEESFK